MGGHRIADFRRSGRAAAVAARGVDGGDGVQAAGKSSRVTGGGWARRVGSASARKPRWSRIFLATSGSSMQAMRRILPGQREHWSTSTEREPFGPRRRPAKAARPNRSGTSTAPTSISATATAEMEMVWVAPRPASLRWMAQRHRSSTVAEGRPCRAGGPRREDAVGTRCAPPHGVARGEVRVRRRDQGDELLEQLDAGHHEFPPSVGKSALHVDTRERVDDRYW